MKIFAGILIFSSTTFCQILSSALLKKCDEPSQVWNRVDGKIKKVGENINEYCEGYLTGIFEAQILNKSICIKESKSDASYLISVFKIYLKENPSKESENASLVVRAAFGNAFQCESGKGKTAESTNLIYSEMKLNKSKRVVGKRKSDGAWEAANEEQKRLFLFSLNDSALIGFLSYEEQIRKRNENIPDLKKELPQYLKIKYNSTNELVGLRKSDSKWESLDSASKSIVYQKQYNY